MTRNRQQHRGPWRLPRWGAAVTAATALTVLLTGWARAAWADLRTLGDPPPATSGDAIADVAAVLALAAWAWLLLGALVTVVEALLRPSDHRLSPRIAPEAWRRLVISFLGIGLFSAPLGIAQASPGDPARLVESQVAPDRGSSAAAGPARAVRGLPLPDRPFSRLPAAEPPGAGRDRIVSPATPQRVTVRAGDSLWAIAERHLDPPATDRAIAAEWRRWYAANRARIGPNPDLIHPGMVLQAPTRKAAS